MKELLFQVKQLKFPKLFWIYVINRDQKLFALSPEEYRPYRLLNELLLRETNALVKGEP